MVWQPSTPALIAVSLSSLLLYMLLPASGRAPLAMADISPHAHHAHGAAGSGAAMGIQHGAMGHGDMMMMPMSFEWTFDTILVGQRAAAPARVPAAAPRARGWRPQRIEPPPLPKPRPQWFKSWHPTDARTWLLSALALAALGVAHEALASYRFSLSRSFAAQKPGALLAHAYLPAPGGGAELAPLGARALHRCVAAAAPSAVVVARAPCRPRIRGVLCRAAV